MNNLAVYRSKRIPAADNRLQTPVEKNSFAIDWDLKVAFFVCKRKLYSLNLYSNEVALVQDNFNLDVQEKDEIVCSNFLLDDKLYFVLLRSGKIVTFDSYNRELFEHSIEVPALIDDAKFSHDQELFALSTRDNQVLLFNKIMILQTSYDMNKADYGINELVNVNWGSKSTQFHGEGMRDKRVVNEEYFPLNKWDDSKSSLDWRGDDNYFVVNFVCSKDFRMLKVFNRQGILQHTSEYVAGLEKQIAWKPSGNLIASSQMLPNKHSVIFFEKNGLKHGEFALPFDPNTFTVEKLAWSHDSEILLVCGYEMAFDGDNYSKTRQNIMLYTQSNYCWYLKQKIQLDATNFIEDILWDEQEYPLLHLLSSQCTYYSQHYNKPVATVEDSKVLVVDGTRLQVSDFERTLVPPPMSNYTICFESQIMQLCQSTSLLAVYLNCHQIVILHTVSATLNECANLNYPISYSFTNVFSEFTSVYMPVFSKKVERISEMILPILLEDGRIFGIIDSKIVCFNYNLSEEIRYLADISPPISALTSLSDDRQLLLASTSGQQLFCYEIESNSLVEYETSSNKMKPVYDDRPVCLWTHSDANGEHIICLTARNSLYYDHSLVLSCLVNSALVYRNKYLLFATTDSGFYCWPLQNFDAFQMNRSHPPRNLEKGSKIIAASSSQAKVVLQLPRGNLEAFHPRLLLLDQVEQLISPDADKLDYLRAFEILRRNRINLNLICDFDFALFSQNCGQFLQQIGEHHLDWICLFLSELSSENVYCTLKGQTGARLEHKVDTVCELLREKMQQIDPIAYLNAILLTYIKKEKPQIDGALQVVKALPSSKLRDGAINFMLYVVNVNRLFDEALGTYDFDILLMVASKSNKDPKEYISLINGFKAIEDEHYRKHKIDMHLQRYKSALLHLSRCDTRFDEALELIEHRHLFKEAIEIYELNSSASTAAKYSPIWNLYGDYLFKKKYYQEAAIAFKRATNYALAFKMCLMDSNWNMASVCARQLSTGEDDFKKQIQPVAQQLVLNGNYVDGSYILEHYLHEPQEAFLTLVKGHEWDHAMRCFHDHQLDKSLFEKHLLPELTSSFESTVENIDDTRTKLGDYLARLNELKESHLSALEAGTACGVEADADVYSDTSSVLDSASVKSSESNQSTNSLKTNRSGRLKSQKRLEQKKYVLKSGSVNEDIQLVYAIKELIGRHGTLLDESRSLVAILYDLYMTQHSSTLQQKLQLLHSQLTSAVEFVWNSDYFERRLSEDEIVRTAPKLDNSTKWALVLN